jgi:DNA-binding NarL/FixJ family response regulator
MRYQDCLDTITLNTMILLTPKEKEFIRLKKQGLKMKEIGELMFMSERSIFTFANELYQKTGTLNGANLIDWSYQNGILKINAENSASEERKAS